MVLILNISVGYGGIGFVDFIWKVYALIVNKRIRSIVILHNTLHGFIQRSGTGTAIMEANIEQKLTGILHKPLFHMQIYVLKAYDSLDRGRFM